MQRALLELQDQEAIAKAIAWKEGKRAALDETELPNFSSMGETNAKNKKAAVRS